MPFYRAEFILHFHKEYIKKEKEERNKQEKNDISNNSMMRNAMAQQKKMIGNQKFPGVKTPKI